MILIAAGFSLLQPASAADNDSNSVIAELSAPSIRDSILYRPRWSLPSNGSLEKLPADNNNNDDDDEVDGKSPNKTSAKKIKADNDEDAQAVAAVRPHRLKPGQISHCERLNLDGSPDQTDQINQTGQISQISQISQKVTQPDINGRTVKSKISALITAGGNASQTSTMTAPIPGNSNFQDKPIAPSPIVPSLSSSGFEDSM